MEAQMKKSQPLAITRLYDAALEGDVPSLLNLLEEDPLILDRCIIEKSGSYMQSPLHVSANFGHVNFTKKIIEKKPKLVEVVDQLKRSSPLHIACAEGQLQIVEDLLVVNSSICYTHDQDGKTPVHVAAMNGRIEVLKILLRVEPQAAWERTIGGETILHLCVKHKQAMALKFLVETMDDDELLNFDDALGNTVLHLAVAAKQSSEMVKFILEHPKIKNNAINKKGSTAVDIHKRSKMDSTSSNGQIWQYLNGATALPAKEALKPKKDRAWLENQRAALMVVASLIATMAFQAGVNPPGGVWQETNNESGGEDVNHSAGTAILSSEFGMVYRWLLVSNTIGLLSSISVILLLISGLPCKRYFLLFLRITLWTAVSAIVLTYMFSVSILIDDGYGFKMVDVILNTVPVVMGTILLGHALRFIWKLVGWQRRQSTVKFCKMCYPRSTNTTNESNLNNINNV